MSVAQFFMPSSNLLGAGALAEAVRQMGGLGFKKALIVTDEPLVKLGLADQLAGLLKAQGIQQLDIAGAGGTSWSLIEHQRREDDDWSLGMAFRDWGIPTPTNIRLLAPISDLTLIASGGVRSGIDMVKALVLGASLCGMATPFLKPAMESTDAVIRTIRRLHKEFATAQFLLGAATVRDLIGNTSLLLPRS